MERERRQRMTEIFAATADAIARTPAPTFGVVVKPAPMPRPSYLPAVPPQALNRAAGRAQMSRLSRLGRRPAKEA